MNTRSPGRRARWRDRIYAVIFEADTLAGKAFDVALIGVIVLSVVVVAMESVPAIRRVHGPRLRAAEWVFTALFSAELILRLLSAPRPLRYLLSFFGIVDMMAVLPTYAGALIPGLQYFVTLRVVRLLRIFRVLKLTSYVREAQVIRKALASSRRKIGVFLLAIVGLVIILGSLMYVVEGEAGGFTDIPTSIYWAIVTMTTVGYGDLSPRTLLGRFLASVVMLAGYSIIAVPTGVFTVEMARASRSQSPRSPGRTCVSCAASGHDVDARFCKHCGAPLVASGEDANDARIPDTDSG